MSGVFISAPVDKRHGADNHAVAPNDIQRDSDEEDVLLAQKFAYVVELFVGKNVARKKE